MKTFVFIVAVLLAFGLAGCGGSDSGTTVAPSGARDSSTIEPHATFQTRKVESEDGDWHIWIDHITLENGQTVICIDTEDNHIDCNWEVLSAQANSTVAP